MARQLKTGLIYSFHYRRFKNDPNPLVLVLYCDRRICHAINFHYLKGNYNIQLIHMIASIASKTLKMKSMYAHYHSWMKRKIPGVIARAYRTYKPQHITGVKKITKGFWGVESFLKSLKKPKHLKLTEVQKRLIEKINKKKAERIKKQEFKKTKITPKQLEENIKNYVRKMDKILESLRKKDKSKYTYTHRRNR